MDSGDIVSSKQVETHRLYDVFEEEHLTHWEDMPPDDTMTTDVARTKTGDYIGDPSAAAYLCGKLGIAPDPPRKGASVCNYGWSEKHERYFGWSHRAVVGFALGDMVFDEDCDGDLPYIERGKAKIKCKDDARMAAQRFAEYIG